MKVKHFWYFAVEQFEIETIYCHLTMKRLENETQKIHLQILNNFLSTPIKITHKPGDANKKAFRCECNRRSSKYWMSENAFCEGGKYF